MDEIDKILPWPKMVLADVKPGGKVKLKDWNMADLFDKYIERILSHEGGYTNHPKDPGGPTNWGITERVARANGYTGDMKAMSRQAAIDIYRKVYWQAPKIDQLPQAIAFQVLDAGVNHGTSRAIKWLQETLGTAADGVLGPKTISAAKDYAHDVGEDTLCMIFLATRLQFYTDIGGWDTFGKGWARRTATNMRYAASD